MLSTIKALRWAQVISIVIVVLIAAFIVIDNRRDGEVVAGQVRERNRLKLQAARLQTERYIGEIQLCLGIISREPHVKLLSDESRELLQAVYEANYDQHHLSEIYVIERDFDGKHAPFMSFERGDDQHDVHELHSLERETQEYAVQMEQVQTFVESPDLEFQISDPVPLCVGEPGLVFSMPIRSENGLVGIVAGMVPSRIISSVLENSSLRNMVLLANSRGNLFFCVDFNETAKSWFATRLAREGIPEFFAARRSDFQAGDYTALWAQADIPGGDRWYVSFIYDEAAALAASGVTGVWAGWGAAVVVLLLGGALSFLCRATGALLLARQQAETRRRALAESEGLTRAAVDGIITMDEHGIVESMNAAAGRIFGYWPEQVIGRNVKMLMASPYREEHDEYLARYRRTGQKKFLGRTIEVVGCRKDGTTFPIEVTANEVRLPGKLLFTAIMRDITDRKRAEEALRESEERLSAILNNTTRVVYLKDVDGKYLLVNRWFEKLLHRSQDEILGKTASDFFPPELAERLHDHDRQVLRSRVAIEFEETVPHDDGLHIYSSIKFPLFNAAGEPYAVCGISADITKRKRDEEEARQRREELAHVTRLATMGEMATGLAHELNQPLAAVVTYLQTCRERIRGEHVETGKLLDDIEHASVQAHRAGEIIRHVRQFIRKAETERLPIDINALVIETVDLAEHLASNGRIDVRLELGEDIPTVLAERIQIQQVILNLIRNALEAMADAEKDRRRLVVRTSCNDRREVELAVCDRGAGLKGRALERAFEPYYTTKHDGMGMGLSISRSIVEKYNGRLWGEPNEDGGTTFRFTLPCGGEGIDE